MPNTSTGRGLSCSRAAAEKNLGVPARAHCQLIVNLSSTIILPLTMSWQCVLATHISGILDELRKYLYIYKISLNIEGVCHEYKGLCCQHWSYSVLSRLHGIQHSVQCFIHFIRSEQLSYISNIVVGLTWDSDIIIWMMEHSPLTECAEDAKLRLADLPEGRVPSMRPQQAGEMRQEVSQQESSARKCAKFSIWEGTCHESAQTGKTSLQRTARGFCCTPGWTWASKIALWQRRQIVPELQ